MSCNFQRKNENYVAFSHEVEGEIKVSVAYNTEMAKQSKTSKTLSLPQRDSVTLTNVLNGVLKQKGVQCLVSLMTSANNS